MGKTSIEWTDRSINPIRARIGENVGHHCVKVSPGCKNCYSSKTQPRFRMPVFQEQRGQDVETFLDPKRLQEVLRRRIPTKWFWCDMTDLFGEWVPFEYIAACFGVMAATPWHTHQVLTKRIDRALEFYQWLATKGGLAKYIRSIRVDGDRTLPDLFNGAMRTEMMNGKRCRSLSDPWMTVFNAAGCGIGDPQPNVWLGTSAENQQTADERIPVLLQCPAAVHFVSAEPLLGPIDFTHIQWPGKHRVDVLRGGYWTGEGQPGAVAPGFVNHSDFPAEIDWIIVGGESGTRARPCNVAWIRDILRQCRDTRAAVFVKQLGAQPVINALDVMTGDKCQRADDWNDPLHFVLKNRKGGDMAEWSADLCERQFPEVRP